ncbi:helix-turn-helix domain-containing protein [Streptomyces sviceus]|uniref:helix-turn-helix domain-containing protein n=1 Tax=Streptomyces sviceus TaxID=285530 RepID=UPI00368C7C79
MLAGHRATLDSGTDQLAGADGESLPLGCCATVATWVCAAVAQQEVLRTTHDALSAAQAAEITGVSRATAQRHLSYLVREGMVRLELRYGATGRPEHLYRIEH